MYLMILPLILFLHNRACVPICEGVILTLQNSLEWEHTWPPHPLAQHIILDGQWSSVTHSSGQLSSLVGVTLGQVSSGEDN